MYVYNNENIFDIPYLMLENKKYMCLNYHDYIHTNFTSIPETEMIGIAGATRPFSHQITKMPDFNPSNYGKKQVQLNTVRKTITSKLK